MSDDIYERFEGLDDKDYAILSFLYNRPSFHKYSFGFRFLTVGPSNSTVNRWIRDEGKTFEVPFSIRRFNKLVKRNLITKEEKWNASGEIKYVIFITLTRDARMVLKKLEAL
jgi:hypothetical protein